MSFRAGLGILRFTLFVSNTSVVLSLEGWRRVALIDVAAMEEHSACRTNGWPETLEQSEPTLLLGASGRTCGTGCWRRLPPRNGAAVPPCLAGAELLRGALDLFRR